MCKNWDTIIVKFLKKKNEMGDKKYTRIYIYKQ